MEIKWPVKEDQHAYMAMRAQQNLERAVCNPNENWMAEKLEAAGLKWKRQAQWGYRIFDFWCGRKGIAVEVDGLTHDKEWDTFRDSHNYQRSGILVIRVRNRNEEDARVALARIAEASSWNGRRKLLGLKPVKGAD